MYKIVILGDPSVGKTSLRKKYMGRGFSSSYLPTMGADFAVHNIRRDDVEVEFQIWDIAGQQGFDLLIPRFISHSNAVIFVFDLTERDTFVNIAQWIKKFKKINEENLHAIPMYMVGNKVDLDNQKVKPDEVTKYVSYVQENLGMPKDMVGSYLTSAKTGENVDTLFNSLIDKLLKNKSE